MGERIFFHFFWNISLILIAHVAYTHWSTKENIYSFCIGPILGNTLNVQSQIKHLNMLIIIYCYFFRTRSSMMRSKSGQMDMCVISTAVKIRTHKDTWADGPWGTLTIIIVRSWRSPVLVWWCVHETALSQTGPNFSWDRPSVTKHGRNSRVCSGTFFPPKQAASTKRVNRVRNKSDKKRQTYFTKQACCSEY